MGIYGGSATNTNKTDWELMNSTVLDDQQKIARTKEQEKKIIAQAYHHMEQAIVNKEILAPEYAKYKDLPRFNVERLRNEHYIYKLKSKLEEADQRIAYYRGKGKKDDEGNEATPEERIRAMDAWFEYMVKLHSREERLEHYNKKYDIEFSIGHILGWKSNPWD